MSSHRQQAVPQVVYARVTKMYLPRSNPNVSRNLFQQIQPGYHAVISPLIPIQMKEMYSSSAILAFRFTDQRKANLTFIITELTQVGEIEICRLCLPLSWFPRGFVVHHYFPFITKTPQNGTPFIELDVHICQVHTTPFSDYYGALTVMPTWTPPPQMIQGVTPLVSSGIPANQQVNQNQQFAAQRPQNAQKSNQLNNQPTNLNQKAKEGNQNDKLTIMNSKNQNKENQETSDEDEFGDESEIVLEDIEEYMKSEALDHSSPPVIDNTETEQNPSQNVNQKPQQPQNRQFQQSPQQQFQQMPPQYQAQPTPQFQQQPQPQQPLSPQYQPPQQYQQNPQQTSQIKVSYPPFPQVSNQQPQKQQSTSNEEQQQQSPSNEEQQHQNQTPQSYPPQ